MNTFLGGLVIGLALTLLFNTTNGNPLVFLSFMCGSLMTLLGATYTLGWMHFKGHVSINILNATQTPDLLMNMLSGVNSTVFKDLISGILHPSTNNVTSNAPRRNGRAMPVPPSADSDNENDPQPTRSVRTPTKTTPTAPSTSPTAPAPAPAPASAPTTTDVVLQQTIPPNIAPN